MYVGSLIIELYTIYNIDHPEGNTENSGLPSFTLFPQVGCDSCTCRRTGALDNLTDSFLGICIAG